MQTKNYHLACFIEIKLNKHSSLIKNGKEFLFDFTGLEEFDKIDKMRNEYSNNGQVPILDYQFKMRELKSRMDDYDLNTKRR